MVMPQTLVNNHHKLCMHLPANTQPLRLGISRPTTSVNVTLVCSASLSSGAQPVTPTACTALEPVSSCGVRLLWVRGTSTSTSTSSTEPSAHTPRRSPLSCSLLRPEAPSRDRGGAAGTPGGAEGNPGGAEGAGVSPRGARAVAGGRAGGAMRVGPAPSRPRCLVPAAAPPLREGGQRAARGRGAPGGLRGGSGGSAARDGQRPAPPGRHAAQGKRPGSPAEPPRGSPEPGGAAPRGRQGARGDAAVP